MTLKLFINTKSDHWATYDQQQDSYLYFQFHSDGTFDRYLRNYKGEFELFNKDGDLMHSTAPWSAAKDSILTWGPYTYDIVNCNENTVVLMFTNPKTKLQSHTFLIREKSPDYRKSPADYEQKYEANPEKYPVPFSK